MNKNYQFIKLGGSNQNYNLILKYHNFLKNSYDLYILIMIKFNN